MTSETPPRADACAPTPLTPLPRELAAFAAALGERYAVQRELGRGGMATVYLARDARHDRLVALKILSPELGAVLGTERFFAEIRVTANLQHPNLLPLFDSGEAAGLLFYVMPHVAGESLRARLEREKQLPVDEAVRIAVAVAGALDHAHRHGVIHRDLKPENILLQDGQPVVADFGIALAVSNAGGNRITQTGLSLGTPAYMSPEQATGDRAIDGRTDIYSLGAVLYEILTGDPPHVGSTAQAVIAKVLTDKPRPVRLARETVPVHVEAAVERALAKLPADRFATAHDLAEALEGRHAVAEGTTRSGTVAPRGAAAHAGPLWRAAARLLVPAASAAVALAAAAWALLRPASSAPPVRWALAFPPEQAPSPDGSAKVSPDGSSLVYVGPTPGNPLQQQLWVKPRDRHDAQPLAGTIGVWSFTFSPDGQSIAFVQDMRLKKIPVAGGGAITLADSVAPGQPGVAWLDDGTIVYPRLFATELRRVPEVGGPWATVARADSGWAVRQPAGLPGARGLLYVQCRNGCRDDAVLWVRDLRRGESHRLLDGVMKAQYVPTGHLVYARADGVLLAVRFDARSLALRGAPVPVLDTVGVRQIGADPLFDMSRSGSLLFRGPRSDVADASVLVWVDRAGREAPADTAWRFELAGRALPRAGWSLSPDGRRVAIALATDRGDDVWVKQLPDGPLSRVTFDSMDVYRPRWVPDGRSISYGRAGALYRAAADGTGKPVRVLATPDGIGEASWSRDGRWLVARVRAGSGNVNRDIVAMRPGVDSAPMPVVASPFEEAAPALSPDGRWIAYESDETGRQEVYVRPFPNADAGKRQVSTGGGFSPLWARDGRELFYVSPARDMIAVAVGTDGSFGAPRALFRIGLDFYGADGADNYTPWDVAPDGRAFLMARRARTATDAAAPPVVVENWFEELRRKTGRR